MVSECGNVPRARRGDGEAELKQVETFARDLDQIARCEGVAGYTLWCFCDYATQRKHRFQRHLGVVDAWRMPKLSAYYMQVRNLERPFIKLHGDWGTASGDTVREVHIFTNCEDVTILRNDNIVTAKKGRLHMIENIDFEPGSLSARGRRGAETVTDRLESYGEDQRIELTANETSTAVMSRRTIGVTMRVVDQERQRGRGLESRGLLDAGRSRRHSLSVPGGRDSRCWRSGTFLDYG